VKDHRMTLVLSRLMNRQPQDAGSGEVTPQESGIHCYLRTQEYPVPREYVSLPTLFLGEVG
jgi:hypothetical protein